MFEKHSNSNRQSNTDKNYKKIAKTNRQALQERLNIYGERVNATFTIGKNEMGYFVSYNDNPIALTSGRSFKELAAYVDGLRDMLLITPNK